MSAAFETIALVGKRGNPAVVETMAQVAAHLVARGCRVLVEDAPGHPAPPQTEAVEAGLLASRAQLIVAVGGDGTMLHAAQLAADSDTTILGINLGRLGFLADVAPETCTRDLDTVLAGEGRREARRLLGAAAYRGDACVAEAHALNDFVVQRWGAGHMIEFETWIDGTYVSTHRADGFIVATPTGSTAYALSGGGPIVHPGVDALVLVPICPHTLSDRPLVVDGGCRIEIRMLGNQKATAHLTADARSITEITPGDRVELEATRKPVELIHPADHDYFRILRSKLHWARGTGDDVPR